MSWNTISKIDMRNSDGELENFEIHYNGKYYRIQNEFGNISFEFDASSGYALVEEINALIKNDIKDDVNDFLNQKDIENNNNQVDMFKKYKNMCKSGHSFKCNTDG